MAVPSHVHVMTRQVLVCLLFLYEHIMCTVFALMFMSSYTAHQHK